MLMVLRAEKKLQNEISLYEPIKSGRSEGNMTFLEVLEVDGDSIFEEVERKTEIKKLRERMSRILTPRELHVIQHRYGLADGCEKTQREIAALLHISRSYVSRIEKKAIKKLHQEMAGDSFS